MARAVFAFCIALLAHSALAFGPPRVEPRATLETSVPGFEPGFLDATSGATPQATHPDSKVNCNPGQAECQYPEGCEACSRQNNCGSCQGSRSVQRQRTFRRVAYGAGCAGVACGVGAGVMAFRGRLRSGGPVRRMIAGRPRLIRRGFGRVFGRCRGC